MIPREELSLWLADGRAQQSTLERMERVTRHLKTLSFYRRLEAALADLPNCTASKILGCAQRAMEDENALHEVFTCLIEASAEDPYFRPALRNISTDLQAGILLFETADLSVSLSVLSPDALAAKRTGPAGARSIVFPGQRSVYRFLKAGGATLSLWEAPPIEPGFTAATSGRCRLVERRAIADGELLWLDGRRQTFVIDHAVGHLVYLQAITAAGRAPLTVEYDQGSLAFAGASSTDEVSSRTQMMLAMLRTMDRADAVPLMVELLASPNFYARWQAMRELVALDAEVALPHLEEMARADDHPEVRAAAASALAACFPEDADAPALEPVLEVR